MGRAPNHGVRIIHDPKLRHLLSPAFEDYSDDLAVILDNTPGDA